MQRLNKILSDAGIAARRKCDDLIRNGKVSVNGKIIIAPYFRADLTKDFIKVNNIRVKTHIEKLYYFLNKPKGYLCANSDLKNRKTIFDLFPKRTRLFSAGRLDKETCGLIFVTNDGKLAQRMIHHSFGLDKEYVVKTEEFITHEHLIKMSGGMWIERAFVKPKKVIKVRKNCFKIIVSDGKKHEVRLIAASAGLTIIELKRVRIGPFTLGALPEGAYRKLSPSEKKVLLFPPAGSDNNKKEILCCR